MLNERVINIFQAVNTTMAYRLRSAAAGFGGPADFAVLDSLFMIELDREKIVLRPFIEEIAETQRLRAPKPTVIHVDVVPPSLEISADPTHLGNVINNLVDNAIKYSRGSVEISIRADRGSISVADNGIGIPAKSLPLIFNKFYRVPTGDRQDVRGYGIGLYYVRGIVEKMGWSISAASTPGKGSAFTIKMDDKDEK